MGREFSRWQVTMASAAQSVLAGRWHTITENLLIARAEYIALLDAEPTDIVRLRKAAQRLYDLQQQCDVLTWELQAQS